MNENNITEIGEEILKKKTVRRGILAGIGALAGGALGFGILKSLGRDSGETSEPQTLTAEQLKEANVSVFNTQDTELLIQKKALDRPLFQDAKNSRTGEVVIVLVDADNISWDTIDALPHEEARRAWQADNLNPKDNKMTSNPLGYSDYIRLNKPFQELHEEEKAVNPDYVAMSERRKKFLEDYPNSTEKNFIYICVGGSQTPTPDQSLKPEMYKDKFPNNDRGVRRLAHQQKYEVPEYAGVELERQIARYKTPKTLNNTFDSDFQALRNVKKSLDFIFRNKHGDTYAKGESPHSAQNA